MKIKYRAQVISIIASSMMITVTLLFSCQTSSHQNKTIDYSAFAHDTLSAKIQHLKSNMFEDMEMADADYTIEEVNTCEKILYQYLTDVDTCQSKEEAFEVVKHTVLELNDLNNHAGSPLIETLERDMIGIIISEACQRKGFISGFEDPTEKLREW